MTDGAILEPQIANSQNWLHAKFIVTQGWYNSIEILQYHILLF